MFGKDCMLSNCCGYVWILKRLCLLLFKWFKMNIFCKYLMCKLLMVLVLLKVVI